MGQDERRDDAGGQEDFEPVTREVREGQSPSVGEEGTEEDREQWQKTRDLHKEAEQISKKADERHR
jgi:hypothetical protein